MSAAPVTGTDQPAAPTTSTPAPPLTPASGPGSAPAPTRSFTTDAWLRTAPVRDAIDHLPFLRELEDGTLPRDTFVHYLAQDAHYLVGYARALAACATRATDADDVAFWAARAHGAVVVERELHATHVDELTSIAPSPTCTAYVSALLATAATGSYGELVAAVLPCFWVYDDVGSRLRERVGDLAAHPYGDWVATYGDPVFAEHTRQAKEIADRIAATSDVTTVDRMHAELARATRYEWMFWDAAYRREAWPV